MGSASITGGQGNKSTPFFTSARRAAVGEGEMAACEHNAQHCDHSNRKNQNHVPGTRKADFAASFSCSSCKREYHT
jgi:hypothetical protein